MTAVAFNIIIKIICACSTIILNNLAMSKVYSRTARDLMVRVVEIAVTNVDASIRNSDNLSSAINLVADTVQRSLSLIAYYYYMEEGDVVYMFVYLFISKRKI